MIGIIYDEDHFRVDVFVNPRFLSTLPSTHEGYLPAPDSSLSLTNSIGLAASGTVGGSSLFNVQNRTVVALRNARLRTNTSVASHLGLVVDDFVGEVDSKDLRYSAGLFWTPGNDFTGHRRIIGAGFGTQFDTWADHDSVYGTPLVVFLAEPARVELLVDGRLITSRSYPAGNNDIDTSALPTGSYSVVLRIHQSNGSVREETRFFVKVAQVAPIGHPIFYAYGGLLASTRSYHGVRPSSTAYYQAGAAWRLTNSFALDVTALGTQHKAIVEGGGWLLRGPARLRAAGLVSTGGDAGALLQLSTGGQGPINIVFDLRRIWSRDGKPLIPLPTDIDTFGSTPLTSVQLATGSYTQATASVGLRLGSGYLSILGSYRKDRHFASDYSVGPSINLPVITRNRLQLVFDASAQRTRTTTSAFAGFRLLVTSGRMSVVGTLGHSYQENGGSRSRSRAVGSVTAQYSAQNQDGTLVNLEGGADRTVDASVIHAGGTIDSRVGDLRADVSHNLEGRGGTQYGVAFQSGMAVARHGAIWGGRDIDQSALVVSVQGDAAETTFQVLVNEVARGYVKAGHRLSLFVPAYRTYKVRLVPTAASAVTYDTAAREVTLYPGNVRPLVWRAQSYFTIFAQAMTPKGLPIANALVQTAKSVAETDANGYFQIDVHHDDSIMIAKADEPACRVKLGRFTLKDGFASIGKVICQ